MFVIDGRCVPNWAEFSEQVEQLLWSYVVAMSVSVIDVDRRVGHCRRIGEAYLKFFTNRALYDNQSAMSLPSSSTPARVGRYQSEHGTVGSR